MPIRVAPFFSLVSGVSWGSVFLDLFAAFAALPTSRRVVVIFFVPLVPRRDPHGIPMRWDDPAATIPDVPMVVPMPVSINPDAVAGRAGRPALHDDRRRRLVDDDVPPFRLHVLCLVDDDRPLVAARQQHPDDAH
jgi:hypothetical protein